MVGISKLRHRRAFLALMQLVLYIRFLFQCILGSTLSLLSLLISFSHIFIYEILFFTCSFPLTTEFAVCLFIKSTAKHKSTFFLLVYYILCNIINIMYDHWLWGEPLIMISTSRLANTIQ